MPTYEYSCGACKRKFSVRAPMENREDPDKCPNCGDSDVSRSFGSIGITFKGKGFYSTDTGRN